MRQTKPGTGAFQIDAVGIDRIEPLLAGSVRVVCGKDMAIFVKVRSVP